MHFYNSVLHYLYIMVNGLVIYARARAFKARPDDPKPKAKAKATKFGLKVKD